MTKKITKDMQSTIDSIKEMYGHFGVKSEYFTGFEYVLTLSKGVQSEPIGHPYMEEGAWVQKEIVGSILEFTIQESGFYDISFGPDEIGYRKYDYKLNLITQDD